MRRRTDLTSRTEQAFTHLPLELKRLFLLEPRTRVGYVLRLLLGITVVSCSRILRLGIEEFEETLCAALQELPRFEARSSMRRDDPLTRGSSTPCRTTTAENSAQRSKLITIAVFADRGLRSNGGVVNARYRRREIADALRAGPAFVTKDATQFDRPSTPGSEYRVLRKGSMQWTCLPGDPGFPHDEPAAASTPPSCAGFKTAAPGARRVSSASVSRISALAP